MEINNSKTLPLLESLDNYSYHTINCEKNKGDKEEITLRALFSVMRQFPPTPLSQTQPSSFTCKNAIKSLVHYCFNRVFT